MSYCRAQHPIREYATCDLQQHDGDQPHFYFACPPLFWYDDPFMNETLGKTPQRLREIRKKYRRLCWESGKLGAGGVRDSELFIRYHAVVRKCDYLLRSMEV